MTEALFDERCSCADLKPYGIHEICLDCGAVFDTTSKRERVFIAYVPAWRLQREQRRDDATTA